MYREQERRKRVLGWRRTHKDPVEGEWEQIFSWLVANPERSSAALPDAISPYKSAPESRGMRKIRAYLLETREEQWQEEVIGGPSFPPASAAERPTGSS